MPTILVADDHAVIRDPLVRLLRHAGYEALPAANGVEALAVLRARHVDVVLLDLLMPKLNGVAFLEALRCAAVTEPPLRDVRVMLLTSGVEDSRDVARARELGVTDIM